MEYSCLSCRCPIEYTPSPTDAEPAPGDHAVCLNCGHLMAFADDMSFRELTSDEAINNNRANKAMQYPTAQIIGEIPNG
jgi:hypothetical protein